MLRTLGIEDEVKSFSVHKPGATVCLNVNEIITALFSWAQGPLPNYSYNTPRHLFDAAVAKAAQKAGAATFKATVRLQKGDGPDAVQFSKETLDAAGGFFDRQPDLIVDASGRARVISKFLNAPVATGSRNDFALFAHLDKAVITDPGNIHIDYLTKGWSWRIPLPGRVSLGVVIHPQHLEKYGPDVEAQYDGYIHEEPSLKFYTDGATRLTPVMRYNNYQLISEKMHGPRWAMIGDAAGFLDPVFSTGVYLGMKSAFELFKAIETGTPEAMQTYADGRHWELKMWRSVIESWYSGRLFNLYRAGQKHKNNLLGARISRRVQWRLLRIFSGEAVDSPFNMKVFEYLISLGVLLRDPKDLVVA
jgi:flavin-dependent dehydrogenase